MLAQKVERGRVKILAISVLREIVKNLKSMAPDTRAKFVGRVAALAETDAALDMEDSNAP